MNKSLYIITACIFAAGAIAAQVPKQEFGFNFPNEVKNLAVDLSGNTYVTGSLIGTQTYGPFTLASNGQIDVYVLKINSTGGIVWAKSFGGTDSDEVADIGVDPGGNVLITGNFYGTVDFDPNSGVVPLAASGASNSDMFILKLDPSGNYVWAGTMGATTTNYMYGMSVNKDSEIYLTGYFTTGMDANPTSGVSLLTESGDNNGEAFFIKLDEDGGLIWARQTDGPNPVLAVEVASDFGGAPIFIGTYYTTVDLDPGAAVQTRTAVGVNGDNYILKLDAANGNYVWGNSVGGDGSGNSLYSIATDGQNNIYVAGSFQGSGDFDPGSGTKTLTSSGGSNDIVVAKFHPSGSLLWALSMGGPDSDEAFAISPTIGGDVYLTGYFQTTADFDPTSGVNNLTAAGAGAFSDIFITKLDLLGNFQWATRLGEDGEDYGRGITTDDSGNFYTVGRFELETDMDPSGCVNLLDPGTESFAYVLKFGTTPSSCLNIDTQPSSQTACANSLVTFSIGVSGTNVTYQWEEFDKDGNSLGDIVDDATYIGGTSSNLSINTSGIPELRSYRCRVNGDASPELISDFAVLLIAPELVAQGYTSCGAGTAAFTATGGVDGEYRWYFTAGSSTAIPGEVNGTYTASITSTTTFFVSRFLGTCETMRVPVTVTVSNVCSPPPPLAWAKAFLGSGYPLDIVVDAAGNSYTTGYFAGSQDFDPGSATNILSSFGNNDAFILKLDAAGEFVWVKQFGGVQADQGNAINIGKDGNIIMAGNTRGLGDFDPGAGTFPVAYEGGLDGYVVKIKPDGTFVWAIGLGAAAGTGDSASDLGIDGSDNIYVAGYFSGTMDFDPGAGSTVVNTAGAADGFLLKLTTDGFFVNVKTFAGANSDLVSTIAVTNSGEVALVGHFSSTFDLNPGAGTAMVTGAGATDIWVAKLDAAGIYQWGKTFGSTLMDDPGEIIIDSDGNIVVSGDYQLTVDFDPGTGTFNMTSNGDRDGFLVKLDGSGNFIYAKSFGGPDSDFTGVASDGTKGIVAYGTFSGTTDFDASSGTLPLTSRGKNDNYILHLDNFGGIQWVAQAGGADDDFPSGAAVDVDGNYFITGLRYGSGDYDPGPGVVTLPAPGSVGGFTMKLGAFVIPFKVTTQPVPVTICIGSTAKFTVTASGAANIKYQWQKYDLATSVTSNVTDGAGYSGATTSTLSVNTTGNFGAGLYRAKASGDGVPDIFSDFAELTLASGPASPVTTGASSCLPASLTLKATGVIDGQYVWYTDPVTESLIAGQTSGTYVTPVLSATTTYFVAISNGTCITSRVPVVASIGGGTAAPTASGQTRCVGATATLTASGGTAGQYLWYDVATGGSPLSETNALFTTPILAATTTYYVSLNTGGCESARTAVTATIVDCANNQPPVIATTSGSAVAQGTTTINLATLISDPDDNVDLSTLRIVVQPKSGAQATIDQNGQLVINYAGIAFVGEDELTIEICDIAASCVQQKIIITVDAGMVVYNAVSPNDDGKNDAFIIEYIELLTDTKENKVKIFNRWGDLVFEVENYNNTTNVFTGKNKNGNDLPSGTYYYKIDFSSGRESLAGYLSLKR